MITDKKINELKALEKRQNIKIDFMNNYVNIIFADKSRLKIKAKDIEITGLNAGKNYKGD